MLQKRDQNKTPYFTVSNFGSGTRLFIVTDVKPMDERDTLDPKRGHLRKMWIKDDKGIIYTISWLSEYYDLQGLVHGIAEDENQWIGRQILVSVIPAQNPKFLNWNIEVAR